MKINVRLCFLFCLNTGRYDERIQRCSSVFLWFSAGFWLVFNCFVQSPVWADQYLTDTPQILKPGYVLMDMYSSIVKVQKNKTFQVPAYESKMWIMDDLQGRFVMPVTLSVSPGKTTTYGYGDLDLGLKYRFIHETKIIPQVAFFPKITLPSGDHALRLGNARAIERVPFWAQKTWGKWILSGGGGYAFDQAPNKYNFLFGGILLRRNFSERLTLGAELFAQGPRSLTEHSSLIVNLGGTYNFTPKIFVLFSAAHSIAGTENLRGFLGLGVTWGPS